MSFSRGLKNFANTFILVDLGTVSAASYLAQPLTLCVVGIPLLIDQLNSMRLTSAGDF